ncbi:unnamed protein product [Owenia fusiformis]|uniref:Uncharacterized protein n=1 Tax=Owenia fusiformis TaxID=6347 RepID=A0A8J1UNS4_OWEFU|nr:unnamed protein product [Owenia fusiformis]
MSWATPVTPDPSGERAPVQKMKSQSRFAHLNFRLTFMDFVPQCINEGGLFTAPTFELFSALVKKANDWLFGNPAMQVRTCETIELHVPVGYTELDANRTSRSEYGKGRLMHIKALRMWISPKSASDRSEPQTIRCINIVPKCIKEGFNGIEPEFDSIIVTLQKFNNIIRKEAIQGKIITVETVKHMFTQWTGTLDADESTYVDKSSDQLCNLYTLRVYYIEGTSLFEELEMKDISPRKVEVKKKKVKFAGHSDTIDVVQTWLREQIGSRLISIQSLEFQLTDAKLTENGVPNTGYSTYTRSLEEKGQTILIHRIFLARPSRPTLSKPKLPPLLNCKTFVPVQLNKGNTETCPGFEGMAETMKRIIAWLNVTNVNIISTETVSVCLKKGKTIDADTLQWTYSNRKDKREFMLTIIRLYIDGQYFEPASNLLPPLPSTATDNEATICSIS